MRIFGVELFNVDIVDTVLGCHRDCHDGTGYRLHVAVVVWRRSMRYHEKVTAPVSINDLQYDRLRYSGSRGSVRRCMHSMQ